MSERVGNEAVESVGGGFAAVVDDARASQAAFSSSRLHDREFWAG